MKQKKQKDTGEGWAWAAIIIILTLIAYFPSFGNLFTNWDDQYYIINNPRIRELSFHSFKSFFSTYEMGNYHPLTMLSLAINYHFSALNPHGYHVTNFLLHLANALLVLVFVKMLCGDIKIAAIVSLLFAIHPMHVESVAWVSERKDVLYTFFYVAALCVYMNYLKERKIKQAAVVFLLYILSLLSKGVAVTLPLALLILDYYYGRKIDKKCILEKIPFFILSLIFGIVAIYAQATTDALQVRVGYSYVDRLMFSSYSLLVYLIKFIFPFKLSPFYDYPIKISGYYPILFYLSPLLIAAIVYFVYWSKQFGKNILFASLFFVASIIIVLQVFPVGKALYADRYTYIPYIGLSFLAGKGYVRIKKFKPILMYLSCFVILIFVYLANRQCRIWKNSTTLWTSAINNAPSSLAYYNMGTIYMESSDTNAALADFNEAILLRKNNADAYINRADLLKSKGLITQAIADCDTVISIAPGNKMAYVTKASCLIADNDYKGAISCAAQAILTDPNSALAYYNKGLALYYLSKYDESIASFTSAININPELKEAYFNRSGDYYAEKKYSPALADALKARELGVIVDEKYIEVLKAP